MQLPALHVSATRIAHVRSGWTTASVYAALAFFTLAPLLLVEIPPLIDYANHLSRYHVIATIDSNPTLQSFFEVRWALLPNLALDLVAPALMKTMSPYDAGRVIVGASMLLTVGSGAALHRAVHGRVGLWPAATFLLVFNLVLAWGFLNYLITVAFALFAVAGWVALRGANAWWRLALFSLVATVLFFGHLLACGIYALVIAAHEAERAYRRGFRPRRAILRDMAVGAGQFAVPFALWFMAPTGEAETYTIYGTWQDKVLALFSPFLFFDTALERGIIIVLGALLIRALFRKYIVIAPGFVWPLVALSLLAAAMPNTILSVAQVGFRLTPVILLLLVGVARPRLPDRRHAIALAAGALAIFAARTASIAESWQAHDRAYAEFRAAAAKIENGARILSVQDRPGGKRHPHEGLYWHLATLATIDRDAFSPTFFADPGKHPVRVRAAVAALHAPDVEPISVEDLVRAADPAESAALAAVKLRYGYRVFWAFWPDRFDYVLVMHFDRPLANPLPRHLTRVAAGSYFDLYRVVR
jgi:hypothetical protein